MAKANPRLHPTYHIRATDKLDTQLELVPFRAPDTQLQSRAAIGEVRLEGIVHDGAVLVELALQVQDAVVDRRLQVRLLSVHHQRHIGCSPWNDKRRNQNTAHQHNPIRAIRT